MVDKLVDTAGQEEKAGEKNSGAVADRRIHLKTLTMATIAANPVRAKMARDHVRLCRIAGIINGSEREFRAEDAGKPGAVPFWALVGRFEADVYSDDGEISGYYGGQCYLPKGFHEACLSELQSRIDQGDESPAIPFNLEMWAVPASNPAGYSYLGVNLNPVLRDPADPLERMRMVSENRPAGLPDPMNRHGAVKKLPAR